MNRRSLLTTLSAGAFMLHAAAHAEPAAARRLPGTERLLIGTSGRGSKGIYASYFHNGTLSQPSLVAEIASPSFLAIPDRSSPHLFAVTQPEDLASHASSFGHPPMTDVPSQTFPHLGEADSGSPGGCHVSVTRDGRSVFVANYGGASVASFLAGTDGTLTLASHIVFPPTDHGPNADRQKQSYAHCAAPSPDGNYVFVNDLGLDRIHIFRLDGATAKLTAHGEWKALPGSGPRHLAFHTNGKWVYSINELTSTIDQLAWDSATGTLTALSRIGTLPAGVTPGTTKACEMVISRDNHFLYASNRVDEDFAVFRIDAATGALALVQHLPNPGKESRHITIDPSGRWFLSADQFSDDISVFPIDPASGRLSARTSSINIGGPSCLLFA